jgi:hypothetical protein
VTKKIVSLHGDTHYFPSDGVNKVLTEASGFGHCRCLNC